MSEIYLGKPPQTLIDWCKKKYPPAPTGRVTKMTYADASVVEADIVGELKESDLGILYYDWNALVENLEDYPNKVSVLPAVGSYVTTAYDVDEETTVPQEWQVMGYNASIPEYVKYRNGSQRVWVRTLKGGLLAPPAAGDAVYAKSGSEYVAMAYAVTSVSGTFSYGGNCAFSVPAQVVVNGVAYDFAGYNVTLLSKLALGVRHENKLYTYAQFDSGRNSYGQNDWSTSMLRSWMNGTGDMNRLQDQVWRDANWSYLTYGSSLYPLTQRYQDALFLENAQKTVNRTWVYPDFRAGKTLDGEVEHVSDRFWLMGIGNINMSGTNTDQYFRDQNCDTSRFSDIFTPAIDIWTSNESRIRKYMNADGTEGAPCTWWLRSAYCDNSCYVGRVSYFGYVYNNYAYNSFGVLPACTIG